MASKLSYAVGLDAGSARTRCVICLYKDARLRLLGFGESASQGWKKGRIADQKLVSESMLAAVREAERTAQVSIESAVLGVGGVTVSGTNNRGVYDVGYPRELDAADVSRAVERGSRVVLPEDQMLLHVYPQDFTVDGRTGHRNPAGLVGARLEAYVHLVTASAQEHYALVGAANHAHLSVEETVFEPLAAAYASVLPEDRREGMAVIDIGAHSTDFAVYYGEALILASSLPICGDHFTRDVARGLYVGYEDAEWIKQQHGCAVVGLTADNSLIEVPSPHGRGPRELPRRELNMILEARAEELFSFVQRELVRIAMSQNLMGVVLTGGSARLTGMCDVAERILRCQARNGLPAGILDWPEELDTTAWTTIAGLAMYSGRLKFRAEADRRGNGFFSTLLR
jgi:cell division protein FtsA